MTCCRNTDGHLFALRLGPALDLSQAMLKAQTNPEKEKSTRRPSVLAAQWCWCSAAFGI